MNKNVIKSLIKLLWIFFAVFIVMKLFFPEQLLLCIENDVVVSIGKFIDSHVAIRVLMNALITVATGHLYFSACKQEWRLPNRFYIALSVYAVVINIGYAWNTLVGTVVDYLILLIIPLLLKCRVSQFLVVFALHLFGQWGLLFIRSSELYISNVNYASASLLVFDLYVWLALYYLYSNSCREEGTLWESGLSRCSVIAQKLRLRRNSQK